MISPHQLHAVPLAEYLRWPFPSGKTLGELALTCPAVVKAKLDAPRSSSSVMTIGSAAHGLLLEGKLPDNIVRRPAEWRDYRTDAARAWRDEQIAAGREILSEEDERLVQLAVNRGFRALQEQGINLRRFRVEASAHDGEIRCRFDGISDRAIFELKAVASRYVGPDRFARHFIDQNWHAQAAAQCRIAKSIDGVPRRHIVLALANDGTGLAACYEISAEMLALGEMALDRGLAIWRRCVETGEWPDWSAQGGRIPLSAPAWAAKMYEGDGE